MSSGGNRQHAPRLGQQGGLIPAVVQDGDNGRVLMLGYMNRDAIDATLDTGHAGPLEPDGAALGPRARPAAMPSRSSGWRPTAIAIPCS